jgi:hypothetical protein
MIWNRQCGGTDDLLTPKGLSELGPEGLNDRSQPRKLSGLECVQSRIRAVENGVIPTPV